MYKSWEAAVCASCWTRRPCHDADPRRNHWTEEACYHVLNRGHNRQAVFDDDEDRRAFLGLLRRYRDRFGFRLYHYCLMSSPVHWVLQLPDPRCLSAFAAGFLRVYGHHVHRRHGFVGALWQGRIKSPALKCEPYLLSCGRYVEHNPLAVGLLTEPWQYAWSSARAHALGVGDPLLAENPWYLGLAASSAGRQGRWQQTLRRFFSSEASVLFTCN
jgi:putative transposase